MQLELIVNGTPSMVASMAQSFDIRVRSRFKDETPPRYHVNDFRKKVFPDIDYVEIMFIKQEPYYRGWIIVERIPKNKSLLTVSVNDDTWPELESIWKLLYDELDKLGYLLKGYPVEVNREMVISEIDEEYAILLDKVTMRKFYQYYSVDTAEEIIQNLQKAWSERRRWSGRWGPGVISRYSKKTPETIGRYLGAFKKAGIDCIKGISIPHTFKSRQ